MAAEVSAAPIADIHVAVGPESEGIPLRTVALVPTLNMAGWLGRLQAQGLDPDLVIPEPLLVGPPEEGIVSYDLGPVPLYTGVSDSFRDQPDLAAFCAGDVVAAPRLHT